MASHATLRQSVPVPERRPDRVEPRVEGVTGFEPVGGELETPFLDSVAPATAFVDEGREGKAERLAGLMHDNADLLEANGMADRHHILGGIMMNEGARNQQVLALGQNKQLRADALAELTRDDPEATPSSREISERAREIGVERRSGDYARMGELLARADGLDAEEKAELARLQGTKLGEFGGATMGDLRGMSPERFRELYDADAQQRFEAHHYKDFRAQIEAYNRASGELTPDEAAATREGRAVTRTGTSAHDLVAENPALADGNFDLLADLSSSFGINQILGSNAYAGRLTANEVDGSPRTVSLDELKQSRERLDPTRDDLFHHVAFWRGLHGKAPSTSYDQVARDFNGNGSSKRARELRSHYKQNLAKNVPTYQRAYSAEPRG